MTVKELRELLERKILEEGTVHQQEEEGYYAPSLRAGTWSKDVILDRGAEAKLGASWASITRRRLPRDRDHELAAEFVEDWPLMFRQQVMSLLGMTEDDFRRMLTS